ncbi:MAG: hypothetical protein RLZZ626_319 [Actinomycetota bacterium]|jgi:uncharacterized membrane protein YhaH (DUF805 family)
MTFVGAIKVCFQKYTTFSGVAGRAEYWYFVLFSVLVTAVTSVIDGVASSSGSGLSGIASISSLASIALVLPRLSVSVRRFRDAGFSPWLMLLELLPIAGLVTWIVSVGVGAFASAANSSQATLDSMSDSELATLFAPFLTPSSLAALGVVILVSLGVGIFLLVVTLLPTKSLEQGNRILAKEVARQQPNA